MDRGNKLLLMLKTCSLIALIAGSLNLAVASPAESQDTNQKLTVEEIHQLVDSHKKVLPEWCFDKSGASTNLEGCYLLPEDATWDEMILLEEFQKEWRTKGCCSIRHADAIDYDFPKDIESCQFLSYTIFCGGLVSERDFFVDLFSRISHPDLVQSALEILDHFETLFPATAKFMRLVGSDGMAYIERISLTFELFITGYAHRYLGSSYQADGVLYLRDIKHIYNSLILELEVIDSNTKEPVSNARVEVTSQWNSVPIIAFTNQEGIARINIVFAEDYPLHFTISGCTDYSTTRSYASSHSGGDIEANQVLEAYTYKVISDDYEGVENRLLIDIGEADSYTRDSVLETGRRIQRHQVLLEKGSSSSVSRYYDTSRRTHCIGNTDADIEAWLNGSLSIDEYSTSK